MARSPTRSLLCAIAALVAIIATSGCPPQELPGGVAAGGSAAGSAAAQATASASEGEVQPGGPTTGTSIPLNKPGLVQLADGQDRPKAPPGQRNPSTTGSVVPVAPVAPQTHRWSGTLAKGDNSLQTGEFFDVYDLQVAPDQRIVATLTATGFDPYLILRSPSGTQEENDDWQESRSVSRVDFVPGEAGRWQVLATSYEPGESGSYELVVEVMGAGGMGAGSVVTGPTGTGTGTGVGASTTTSTSGAAAGTPGAPRREFGRLEPGDTTLNSGEFTDAYSLTGVAGETVVLDLRSGDFDPYLIFRTPSGQQFDNDDHDGSSSRSLLTMTLTETGTHQVLVTSYKPGMSGTYNLEMRTGASAPMPQTGSRTESGTLAQGDTQLRTGEFMDIYSFTGSPGQRVRLDLTSSAFDTYLILKPPGGGPQVENDDAAGVSGRSLIEHTLGEAGLYQIVVTSYEPGESGAYQLQIDVGDGPPTPVRSQDVSTLAMGQNLTGRLESTDSQLPSGRYRDWHVFEGTAGQAIVLDMRSSDLDPYLTLRSPNGQTFENDDWQGSRSHSRIELQLAETGRYRVETTSYDSEATGAYTLALSQGSAAAPVAEGVNVPRRTHGLFVGISEYGGRANDLQLTADDARRLHSALVEGAGMRPEDGILLLDAEATKANFQSAIQRIANTARPHDVFVLFYSGHGGRQERTGPFQAADPDGLDEALMLRDADLLDDELFTMLTPIQAETQVIVLDSCFSGGFQKDLIATPGRMGLFSSEEDVVSMTAAKFLAGGFLSKFFDDAVRGGYADADSDGFITAHELSYYIGERYREDVKSDPEDVVSNVDRNLGYQKLVVDRGSLGPAHPLFELSVAR